MDFLGPVWEVILVILKEIYPFILAGGAAVGALFGLDWLKKHPEADFNKYYPYVIMGIKYAEKVIPPNSPNKSLAKADAALQEFVRIYEANEGKAPSEALKAWANRVKEIALIQYEASKNKPTPPTV